jgi:hypothetical protein
VRRETNVDADIAAVERATDGLPMVVPRVRSVIRCQCIRRLRVTVRASRFGILQGGHFEPVRALAVRFAQVPGMQTAVDLCPLGD